MTENTETLSLKQKQGRESGATSQLCFVCLAANRLTASSAHAGASASQSPQSQCQPAAAAAHGQHQGRSQNQVFAVC